MLCLFSLTIARVENSVKRIGIRTLLCLIVICTPIALQSQDGQDDYDNTDIERTTEVTVQTPWLHLKMLSDDPFVQVTIGFSSLLVVAVIVLIGHHVYYVT